MSVAWIYPFIVLGGVLQTCGALKVSAALIASLVLDYFGWHEARVAGSLSTIAGVLLITRR